MLIKIIFFDIYSWFGRGEDLLLENYVFDWIKRGVIWIGGCCRIKLCDIKSLGEEIKKINRQGVKLYVYYESV